MVRVFVNPLLDTHFADSQIPRFPDSQIPRFPDSQNHYDEPQSGARISWNDEIIAIDWLTSEVPQLSAINLQDVSIQPVVLFD
jgi:hypothetical protein